MGGDTGDTGPAPHSDAASASIGGDALGFDMDLVFEASAFDAPAHEPVGETTLESNDLFNFSLDDLWSADLAQLPIAADNTDFIQAQHVSSHHEQPQLQGASILPQNGPEYLTQGLENLMRTSESPASTQSQNIITPSPLPPKIGHRFTLEAIRVLKDWFSRHAENPYPNDEEKTMLEQQTGLSRTQITNWLANTRRRRPTADSGTQTGRSGKSPSDATYTPTRAGTPIPRRPRSQKDMHPLQRWVDSPPENEPAAVSAIERAMASGELVSSQKALPPYLVELERGTPMPFMASGKPPDSPRSAYELITMELAYFLSNHTDTIGGLPSHTSLQLEACRIMFASEVTFPEPDPDTHCSSWFRDLLLSSDEIAQQARFAPIRSQKESRLSVLRIKGKNALFEDCANDWILGGNNSSTNEGMTWLTNEPEKSTNQVMFDAYLDGFTWLWSDEKSPPKMPETTPSPGAEGESTLRPTWLGPGIYVLNDPNHLPWFAREMKRWVKAAMSPNNPICHVPSDEELRHQARCLLYNE
ncbi:Mating-type protein ALPHA2 [Fusarium austroafricanum]|uniref:Mating-type protein ALPHA2 n=1 Tax=Fusarium austroafricanum TaxID=2364996 RepID=A0A8H4P2J2_9HYPO|nr:Mating-type protein ALPHA2 [Fusarium austroafricanum]